jgi:hypothetical protein
MRSLVLLSQEALHLLKPMLLDRIDFVRQAAFIALSMVLIQSNAVQEPYVTEFRAAIHDIVEKPGTVVIWSGFVSHRSAARVFLRMVRKKGLPRSWCSCV